ncbi:MAG: hypothetical protein ACM3MK_05945 [Chitinophagales bacterium]
MNIDWYKELEVAVTICNREGQIIYMNDRSAHMFEDDGGYNLMGQNLLDCHPGLSNDKVKDLLDNPRTNCYTIERQGKRKLIYQMPWSENGVVGGLLEIVLPLPEEIPHFLRK